MLKKNVWAKILSLVVSLTMLSTMFSVPSVVNASGYGANIEGWQYVYQTATNEITQQNGTGPLTINASNAIDFLVLNGDYADDANKIKYGKNSMTNYTVEYDIVVTQMAAGGYAGFSIISYEHSHLGLEGMELGYRTNATYIDKQYVAGADYGQLAGTPTAPSIVDGKLHHFVIKKTGATLNVYMNGNKIFNNVTLPTRIGVNGNLSRDMTASGYVGFWFEQMSCKIANVKVTNDTNGQTQTFFNGDITPTSGFGANISGWASKGTLNGISQDGGTGPLIIDAADSLNEFLILNGEQSDSANKNNFGKLNMTNYSVEYDLLVSGLYGTDTTPGSLRWVIISYNDTHMGLEAMHLMSLPSTTVINKEYVAGADFGQLSGTPQTQSIADGQVHHVIIQKDAATLNVTLDGVRIYNNITLPNQLGTNGNLSQSMRASGYVGFQLDHMRGKIANVTVTNNTTGYSQTFFAGTLTPSTTYYVSSSTGSDSNDGKTPQTAYQSCAPINSKTLNSGDTVLFKRGDTFTDAHLKPKGYGAAAKGKWITISAYGSGNNPLFQNGGTLEPAISLTSANTFNGYIIQNIDVKNYKLGLSCVKSDSQFFNGLQIINCNFTDILTNAPFDPNITGPENSALAWGIWLKYVKNVLIQNVTTNNCDSPVEVVGSLIDIDRLNAFDSAIQGLMLYNCDVTSQMSSMEGKIIVKNSKIINTGRKGLIFGTTGILLANTRDSLIADTEVAYTVNGGLSYDACAIDFETYNVNNIISNCYVHDNDGAFLLAMEHDDTIGYSTGNVVKNCISVNNGRRDTYSDVSFVAHSSYPNANQAITIQNCTDIGLPGSVPYSYNGVLASTLPSTRFNISNFTSGTENVSEYFDEAGLGSFTNTAGASVSNSHLALTNGAAIRTNYSGTGYIVRSYIKGSADLMLLANGTTNGYAWKFASGKISPYKQVNGVMTKLKDINISGFNPSEWFRIRVEIAGNVFKTYLNDSLVDTLTDTTFTSGSVGFNASGSAQADNLLVYKYVSGTRNVSTVSIPNIAPNGTFTFAGSGWHAPETNWSVVSGISSYTYEPFGVGYAVISGSGATLQKNTVNVNVGSTYKKVNILMYNATTNPTITVQFSTNGGSTWYSKTATVRAKSNDVYPFSILTPSWKNYVVDMTGVTGWSGTINAFRIQFGATSGNVSVKQVVISQ